MGMGKHLIEAIIREHRNKPIGGDVLLIGRQTTYLFPDQLLVTIREHRVRVDADPSSIELDETTVDRKRGYAERLVSDAAPFKLLGARSVKALIRVLYRRRRRHTGSSISSARAIFTA